MYYGHLNGGLYVVNARDDIDKRVPGLMSNRMIAHQRKGK